MAALSGLTGSLTFGAGYTLIVDGWTLNIIATAQPMTPLSPAGNHETNMGAGLLKGGTGSYHCKLAVGPAALYALAGAGYDPNPEEWSFESSCNPRETTPLGAVGNWRTFLPGLIRSRAELVTYLDDAAALPLGGAVDTATLTISAGLSLSLPYVVENTHAGIDTGDIERRVILSVLGTEAPTPTGAFPLAGITGVATLDTDGALDYTLAEILITSSRVRVNRRTSLGSVDCDFVVSGAIT